MKRGRAGGRIMHAPRERQTEGPNGTHAVFMFRVSSVVLLDAEGVGFTLSILLADGFPSMYAAHSA